MTFSETVRSYPLAVKTRNLKQLEGLLADDLTLITLAGDVIQGHDALIDFHEEWFEDKAWKISFEAMQETETPQMGFALYAVQYDDTDEDGEAYRLDYYLTLVFKKDGDNWRLVLNQGTLQADEDDE